MYNSVFFFFLDLQVAMLKTLGRRVLGSAKGQEL